MPKQTQQSSLFAKLGNRVLEAYKEHKNDTLEVGNPTLPAGIEGGIAVLHSLKIGTYKEGTNAGQPYFMAEGIVKRPHKLKDRKVSGLRTRVGPEPLCDTPTAGGKRKTFSDHCAWMLNQLRLLTESGDPIELSDDDAKQWEEDLKAVMLQIEESKPHFSFRTWKGKKQVLDTENGKYFLYDEDDDGNRSNRKGPFGNEALARAAAFGGGKSLGRDPMVQHEWNGWCQFDEEEEDDIEETVETPTTPNGNQPTTKTGKGGKPPTAIATANGDGEEDNEFHVMELVQSANQGSDDAKEALEAMARSKGITDQAVEEAQNWEEVADLILHYGQSAKVPSKPAGKGKGKPPPKAPEPEPEPEETEEEESEEPAEETEEAQEDIPVAEQIYKYKPIDPATKKRMDKAVEVEVLEVDEDKKTVKLRNVSNPKKTYTKVPWDDLSNL